MFNGHIPFTPIIIDDFTTAPILNIQTTAVTSTSYSTNTPLAFFLTHYHKDHIRGLTPHFSRGFVYATKVTRALLLIDLPQLRPHVRTFDLEEKTAITLGGADGAGCSGGYTFYVTAFDANHCPGAAILLFHLPNTSACASSTTAPFSSASYRSVIHTGDMRYDPIRFHSPLLLSAVNHIDTLYLDCTFFHPTAALFPTKAESIRLLTTLIATYFKTHTAQYTTSKQAAYYHPLAHPRVYIAADMLGTEELLLALFAHFGHRMYVAKEWDRWRQLALLKRTLPLLTNEQWSTPFTICPARQFQQFRKEMENKRSQQPNSTPALYIKPSAMWFVRLSEQRKGGLMQSTVKLQQPSPVSQSVADEEVDVEAVWNECVSDVGDSDWVARDSCGVVHVLWSMHSAMSECLHFIQLLQPRYIVPINPPAALSSLPQSTSQHESTDSAFDTETKTPANLGLVRKRRNSSIYSTTITASLAERDRAVVTSLQRYIDSLLPHKRITVRSPITAADAEAADSSSLHPPSASDMVPDTPPRLQGVKRMHSSPCKLPSSSSSSSTDSINVADVKVKVQVGVGTAGLKAKVAGVKADVKDESGGSVGSVVSRALFGMPPGGIARAHSTLLVVREDMDRTLVWHGAKAAAVAAAAAAVVVDSAAEKKLKQEMAGVVDDMPSLTK